jgi:hypothetical protein
VRQTGEDSKVVVLGGNRYTIAQLKEQLNLTLISERPSISLVMKVLHDTRIPLTRAEIAEKTGKSVVQTSGVLRELLELEFVARMKLTKHTSMYALTERGYKIAKQKFEAEVPKELPVVTLERGDTLADVILKFFAQPWGQHPRDLQSVREALQSYGLNYPKQSIAVALLRLVKVGRLLRTGGSSGGFRYTIDREKEVPTQLTE